MRLLADIEVRLLSFHKLAEIRERTCPVWFGIAAGNYRSLSCYCLFKDATYQNRFPSSGLGEDNIEKHRFSRPSFIENSFFHLKVQVKIGTVHIHERRMERPQTLIESAKLCLQIESNR